MPPWEIQARFPFLGGCSPSPLPERTAGDE